MKTYKQRVKLSFLPKREGTATEPKRILVPIDFSPACKKALLQAARLAGLSGAKITLLHVIETLPLQAALGYVPHEVKKEHYSLLDQGKAVLTAIGQEALAPQIAREAVVRVGVPYQIIVEVARTLAVDLIVITTQGHTRLQRALLGSTAERVVRHAPCAVLVLRD